MATQTKPQDDAGLQGNGRARGAGTRPRRARCTGTSSAPVLIQDAIRRGEGQLADMGPFCAVTSPHTGRSPNDKFVVKEPSSEGDVDWGKVNQPFTDEQFETLLADVRAYLNGQRRAVRPGSLLRRRSEVSPVRALRARRTRGTWRSCGTCSSAPTRPSSPTFDPNFTVLHAPEFQADPAKHGTRTSTFIVLNLAKRMILIGGTRYAGELKKAMFTVMNYYMPKQGVLSMHCSANIGKAGDTALFFGLSGTGKTTLSADPERSLIGDDEHGWSPEGIFNYEGGCYAKVINLSPEGEPDIYRTTQMFGTILENVVLDPTDAEGEVRGSVDHREHARVVSAALHPEPRADRPRRASEEHRLPHRRCVRRAAADRASSRASRRCTTSCPATRRRSPAPSAA